MEVNYPTCYKAVRVYEGGNDDDPHDPGGRTSRGIIQREWDKYRKTHPGRPADVWKAPDADIAEIYRNNYWSAQGCGTVPSGVDESVFDYGVNSGIGRSQKVLRRCLHLPDKTPYSKVAESLSALTGAQVSVLIDAINDERIAFLRQLRIWKYYGKGWSSRVASVRKLSHNIEGGTIAPAESKARGQIPEPKAAKKITQGIGLGTSGGSLLQHDPLITVLIIAGVIAAVGVTIYLINKRHKKKQEAPPKGWVPPPQLKPNLGTK